MIAMKLDHLAVTVRDMERSLEFYRDLLGFVEKRGGALRPRFFGSNSPTVVVPAMFSCVGPTACVAGGRPVRAACLVRVGRRLWPEASLRNPRLLGNYLLAHQIGAGVTPITIVAFRGRLQRFAG